jgi:uncharacterized protein involved in exopolysaccharide biosynthesis
MGPSTLVQEDPRLDQERAEPQATPQGTDPIALLAANPARELLAILQRHRGLALTVFLGVTAIAVAVAILTPPVYEAEASLIVRIGREYVYRPEVGRTDVAARNPSMSEIVNSEVEILSSPDLAEQVVRKLGVATLYTELPEVEPDPEMAVKKAVLAFRQAATVHPVLESSVIKVAFDHPVPQVAADAVNLLMERFTDKHVEVFSEERSGRLEEEFAARTAELERAENALGDFKRENRVSDLAQQRVLMLGQRARLEDSLGACEEQLAVLRQRLDATQLEDSAEPAALPSYLQPEMKDELLRQLHELETERRALESQPTDRVVEEASLRLMDLGLQEKQLLQQYSEGSRKVQGVRSEIASVRSILADAQQHAGDAGEARQTERSSRGAELRREIARVTRDIELLVHEEGRQLGLQREDTKRRLAALDEEIVRLDQHDGALRRLERERAAAESAVQVYRDKLDEARISNELDRDKEINVRVIARATAPVQPIGLSPKLEMALGALVGLLAGAGVAVLFDLLRAR